MPTAIREQVIAALATAIDAALSATVERNRDTEVDSFPTVVIFDGNQTKLSDNTGMTAYTALVEVEGHVQAATAAELGAAITDLYAQALDAAVDDPTLGGLSQDVREGAELIWDIKHGEGGKPTGSFSMTIEIDFFTASNDPFTLGPA